MIELGCVFNVCFDFSVFPYLLLLLTLLVLVLLFWLSFGVEFNKFCENLVSKATNTIFILYICICTNVGAAAIKIKWKRKTEPFYAHIQTRSRNTQSIVMCADVYVRCSFSIYVAAITITAQTIFPDRSFYLSFIFFFFQFIFILCYFFLLLLLLRLEF